MIERVEVVAGPGTVIRYGAVVAWAGPSASPALVSFLAQSARNLSGSGRGGRQMADHIAGVLRERDPEPHVAFAVVGPDALGWASLLHGPVQAWDGQRWLAPSPSPGWLQAIITPQPSVMVNAAGSPVPVVAPDSMWDLESGVVPGSGFVLFPSRTLAGEGASAIVPSSEPQAEPVAPAFDPLEAGKAAPLGGEAGMPEAGVPGVAVPGVDLPGVEVPGAGVPGADLPRTDVPGGEPAAGGMPDVGDRLASEETSVLEASPPTEVLEPAEPRSSFGSGPGPEDLPPPPLPPPPPGPPGSIDLRVPGAGDPRPPLASGFGPDRSIPGAPVVGGLLCEREHLNRPGLRVCVRCGAPVIHDTTYTVSGTRPPLGCLVGDDGTIWRLDSGYLVGSNPASDPTVRGGIARPLSLEGVEMSAAHAEVRLAGWDVEVVDRSSAGGTFVFEPGGREWVRLRPYEPRALKPGTHIAFGQRIVTFLTPWAVPEPSPQ